MSEAVCSALAKQLRIDLDRVTLDSRIKDDLGADSLDVLQLLMTIEEQYGVTVPDEKLAAFERVSDVVAFLEEQKVKA
ncbi:MAG: acyl carrier protein [Clostridia bacterium]|nr:acyl carrier protein [Clostridia bacterium]